MSRLYIKGIGMMAGLIIGAGVFALPYAFAQAGVFWGTVHLAVSLFVVYFLHQWYGEVSFYTKGRHRFVGFVEMYLGKKAKFFSLLTTLGSYYFSLPYIKTENFFSAGNWLMNKNWFLPYGVWLFSLTGFSAIPPTRDIFFNSSIKSFKRVVSISLFLAAAVYAIFIFSILGVSGSFTTVDALSGIKTVMGAKVMAIGSIIGFLAVFTSFIALAVDMKSMFRYDYKIHKFPAWLLVVIPPVIIYLKDIGGFINILAVTGSVGMGILGIFIVLMRHKIVKILKIGDKEDLVAEIDSKEIKIRKKLEIVILVGIISAVLYDIWNIVSKL